MINYKVREGNDTLFITLEDGREISIRDNGPRIEVSVPEGIDVWLDDESNLPRYKTNLVYFREMRKRSYKWTNLKKLVRELSTKSVFGMDNEEVEE